MVVRGIVMPYVGGQTVKVSFYREGARWGQDRAAWCRWATARGSSRSTTQSRSGAGAARAAHAATLSRLPSARARRACASSTPTSGPGASGPSVRLLQSELNALHYAVPLNGVLRRRDRAGADRLSQDDRPRARGLAGQRVFELLGRGAGSFHVRYPRDGRHVEADLTKQVLAEIEPGGGCGRSTR